MVNHQENGTWSLVPCHSVPKRAKVLRTKWVYDDKKGLYAMIVQVMPRLTAMGNVQREGVGYSETYASVMRAKAWRVLLQLPMSSLDHEMVYWDMKAAFTHAVLEEDTWIYQLEGHQQEGSGGMICKLFIALYGLLKRAGGVWQMLLKSVLSEAGFSDCVFVAHPGTGWCVVGAHVEDLFPLHSKQGRILRDVDVPGSSEEIALLHATRGLGFVVETKDLRKLLRYLSLDPDRGLIYHRPKFIHPMEGFWEMWMLLSRILLENDQLWDNFIGSWMQ
jgi:hypothetical protein